MTRAEYQDWLLEEARAVVREHLAKKAERESRALGVVEPDGDIRWLEVSHAA